MLVRDADHRRIALGLHRRSRTGGPQIPGANGPRRFAMIKQPSSRFREEYFGRAPEHRGNGLKFVKERDLQRDNRGMHVGQGRGLVDYGKLGPECRRAAFPGRPGQRNHHDIVWSLK